MRYFFGLPMFVGIALGLLMPYGAIEYTPFGFGFLAAMTFLAGLNLQRGILSYILLEWRLILFTLFLMYFLFPLMQWYLVTLLELDGLYTFGLYVASLMPSALVIPYFCVKRKGDVDLGFVIMVTSTLLCPLILPLMLKIGPKAGFLINQWIVAKAIVLLVFLPLVLSQLVVRYMVSLKSLLIRNQGKLNSLLLSLMVYLFFGSAIARVNIYFLNINDVAKVSFAVLFQDFGVYLIAKFWLRPLFKDERKLRTIIIACAAKNTAIAAALMIYFAPNKTSLPAILTFMAHVFLFSFLGRPDRKGELT